MRKNGWTFEWTIPVVGETYDGRLHDIDGGHIHPFHVFSALDTARSGPVEEGSTGGGTGMICYEYKGGIGTSSRVVSVTNENYTIGVLVQANYGRRRFLRIAGLRMGEKLNEAMPHFIDSALISPEMKQRYPAWCGTPVAEHLGADIKDGSIIVVVATDAPLLPHQLKRLAKRPSLGIGRLGGVAADVSGEIFLAFSTANADIGEAERPHSAPYDVKMHPNLALTPLFEATVDATEEAILNAMVAAKSCEGVNGLHVERLPHDGVREQLIAHNLLADYQR
jgi:L-aminopeptidase/D-esterase-like protein